MYSPNNEFEMVVNGLKCTFNMPAALEHRIINGEEVAQGLPPHNQQKPYKVDEYPACPNNWMHGSAEASSYFVPVRAGRGMWLDFNANANYSHDLAIAISIQGINPLTGQKSDKMRLEQYRNNCPLHNVKFKQDNYCEECKYKWPAQNYLATTGTPNGSLWLDGFMAEDGVIRQYIFTEEMSKGVAAQVIKEDRVFAIGIAFFKAKNPKPKPVYERRTRGGIMPCASSYGGGFLGGSLKKSLSSSIGGSLGNKITNVPDYSLESSYSTNINTADDGHAVVMSACSADFLGGSSESIGVTEAADILSRQADIEAQQKLLEIGAGARINQEVHRDPQDLTYWEDTPTGFIYINYCDEQTANRILAAGKRQDRRDGFLSGLNLAK